MGVLETIWEWLSDQDRQRTLAFVGGGLVVLVAGGWQLYLHLAPERQKLAAAGSQTITAGQGNISGVIVGPGGSVGPVQIQQGDSDEVRRQKLERAQVLLGAEVKVNLRTLDRRLALVDASVPRDTFEAKLSNVRRQVAPAAEPEFSRGYRQLSASSQAASLRHALNGERLRSDVPGPLVQVLLDSGAPGEPVEAFHAGLAEVERVTESLLAAMEDAGRNGSESELARRQAAETLALALTLVHNRTQLAYLQGLRLLDTLGAAAAPVDLSDVRLLEPRRPLAQPEYAARLVPLVEEGERLLEQRRELVQRAGGLLDAMLDEYRQISEQVKILPSDTWAVVVGKARALRELGRIGEAAAAFGRYAEMFASTDPGAVPYARTAQEFTTQLKALGVTGGVYLFAVTEGGTAARAGLRAGDIVVSYAGTPTPGSGEMAEILSRFTAADSVRIDYLRREPTGEFTPGTVSLPGGPLGAGIMPI